MYRCLIYVHGLLFISASVPLLRVVQSDSTCIFSSTPCANAGIPGFYYFKCNTLYSLYLFQCVRRILISAMFALLLSRTLKASPQSKKSNKKGTPLKVFYSTRLKWGSCSSGGIYCRQRALCTPQTWLYCISGLAFLSCNSVLLEQHRGLKHSSSSGRCSSVYLLKATGCADSEPTPLHSDLIRGHVESREAGLPQEPRSVR